MIREIGPAVPSPRPPPSGLHHAWLGGLLEHVLQPGAGLPWRWLPPILRSTRTCWSAGAILHDIGKVRELALAAPNFELHAGRASCSATSPSAQRMLADRSTATLNAEITAHGCRGSRWRSTGGLSRERLRLLLEHMILLAHHGKLEFGSPKLPMTRGGHAAQRARMISKPSSRRCAAELGTARANAAGRARGSR